MSDTLDYLHLVPGGAQFVREIRALVEHGNALDRELEFLHRRLRGVDMPLFGPAERTTALERGRHFTLSMRLAGVSEYLQQIATHRAVHQIARKYAAHTAKLFLHRALHYHAGFQTALKTPPEFRKLSSGPLCVAWVSGGTVRLEYDAFPAVCRNTRPEPVPEHLRNNAAFTKYTEERVRNPDFKPPTADTVELNMCGTSCT